jgi:hypothetical protein
MNEKKFPWNPHGFIRPSVEHLFALNTLKHRTNQPPKPASNFIITKPRDPASTSKLMKARI